MTQENFSFNQVRDEIIAFNKRRGWLGLDSADLAKSIVLEASELLEHYQWDNTERNKGRELALKNKEEISAEVADVFIYLVEFCYENKIDLLQATVQKMTRNNKKYPAPHE